MKIKQKPNFFLELITGPMFAGKTTHLIRKIHYYTRILNKECLTFKPCIDVRIKKKINAISTHKGHLHKAIPIKKNEEILDFIKTRKKMPDIVFISEFSLFEKGLTLILEKIHEMKIKIIAEGIDKDYLGNYLPEIKAIKQKNIKIKKIFSNCFKCFAKATYSKRLINKKEIILIGDKNFYAPTCKRCWEANL